MTLDLDARLSHLAELRRLKRKLAHRIDVLEAPLLTAAQRRGVAHGEIFCCKHARVTDVSPEPVDNTIHFEWACDHHGYSAEVFQVPIEVLQTLLDPPKS